MTAITPVTFAVIDLQLFRVFRCFCQIWNGLCHINMPHKINQIICLSIFYFAFHGLAVILERG